MTRREGHFSLPVFRRGGGKVELRLCARPQNKSPQTEHVGNVNFDLKSFLSSGLCVFSCVSRLRKQQTALSKQESECLLPLPPSLSSVNITHTSFLSSRSLSFQLSFVDPVLSTVYLLYNFPICLCICLLYIRLFSKYSSFWSIRSVLRHFCLPAHQSLC